MLMRDFINNWKERAKRARTTLALFSGRRSEKLLIVKVNTSVTSADRVYEVFERIKRETDALNGYTFLIQPTDAYEVQVLDWLIMDRAHELAKGIIEDLRKAGMVDKNGVR